MARPNLKNKKKSKRQGLPGQKTEGKHTVIKVKVKSLSRVQLFVTPWTIPARLLLLWDFPGKITGVGCHFLLQGIFPTQGSNPGLLHCRKTLYCLSHKGSSYTVIKFNLNAHKQCLWPRLACLENFLITILQEYFPSANECYSCHPISHV